jgi:hypothetical protein
MNRRPKAKAKQIIPIEEYDGIGPIVAEDDIHLYILGHKGHLTRLRKKTCSRCASTMSHVIIFEYKRHTRVERFCRDHAAQFGELPEPIPIPNPIPEEQLGAIQKWTNIKVRI